MKSCFLESTGIAAGASLVAALTAETIDKGLVKKLIKKVATKAGLKIISGVGLALLIVGFSYCMFKEHHKS